MLECPKRRFRSDLGSLSFRIRFYVAPTKHGSDSPSFPTQRDLNPKLLLTLMYCISMQGIIQLSIIFMQIAPITVSFAVVNIVEAAVR